MSMLSTPAEGYKPGPTIEEVLAKVGQPAEQEEPAPEQEPAAADAPAPDGPSTAPAEGEASEARQAANKAAAQAAVSEDPRARLVAHRLEERARQLEERERRYRAEIEPVAKKVAELREQLVDAPAAAFKALLAETLGVDEAQAEAQLDVIIEERTRQKLGLVADSDTASGSNPGTLQRQVLQMRAAKRADEERRQREAEEHAAHQQIEEAVANLDGMISQAEKEYPWLHVQDNPGRIVLEMVLREKELRGRELSFEEAAKAADDYYQEQERAWYDKRKALFGGSTAPAPAAAPPSASDARDPATSHERPRSLTHAAATAPVTPREDEKMPEDPEAAKDWILWKHFGKRAT